MQRKERSMDDNINAFNLRKYRNIIQGVQLFTETNRKYFDNALWIGGFFLHLKLYFSVSVIYDDLFD